MNTYTFEVPTDRGPDAWERYTTESIQVGAFSTENEAWNALVATIGEEASQTAWVRNVA